MVSNSPCSDENNEKIEMKKEKILEFPEKTFKPFNNYKFTLSGNKNGKKSNSAHVVIIITELGTIYYLKYPVPILKLLLIFILNFIG